MADGPASAARQEVAALVDAHVRGIVDAAERAALRLSREVEEATLRRALQVREEAEGDAAAIREAAAADARALVEESRRRGDTWAAERIARLEELSDDLVAGAEAVRAALPDALELQRLLDALVVALGDAARATVAEATHPADDG